MSESQTEKKDNPEKGKSLEGTYWVSLPVTLPEKVSNLTKRIYHDDLLYDEVISKNHPIETRHHVTLNLGLPPIGLKPELIEFVQNMKKPELVFETLGFFSNPPKEIKGEMRSWDALYAVPTCESIQILHDYINTLYGVEWIREKYVPHVTLAFLKYGKAEGYVNAYDMFDGGSDVVVCDHVSWIKFRDKSVPDVKINFSE